ncbi:uncharacterized protein Z520_00732 [Fonsecaea multimorphosa CBS 102226]|uniref:Uncharacterized protein n=1 Tax=Fonsecaea multimorphosa CBS 102226 TaxID=1442371 RepID=A0A0D2KKN2_9EURO|nr:uncharacterized protein Z520_00732 [Fonsecaea multimorphosa CBS 102226]KIY04040.1 hypothetical protein Z520_00732 [Fonsecaea multimorphosa CBS 102226]
MRKADTTIPLKLGNLRQELEEERALLRYRCREGDPYGVFPSLRKRTRKQREVSLLLQSSIEKLWLQFKNIERPFLIGNSLRAEQVQRGDYWGESDIEEKPRARPDKTRTRDRVDLAEAGLAPDQQPRYYRTDLAHRFIWWQSVSAVEDMLNQVQRIQIRRMERDVFETDELVKRCLNTLKGSGGRGRSVRGGFSSSGGGSGGRGGGIGAVRRRNVRSRTGTLMNPGRRSSAAGEYFREVEEKEIRRVRSESGGPREGQASNTGRRRNRSPAPRYEYEVIHPGRISVDVGGGEPGRFERIVRRRSYSRDRSRGR